MTLPDSQWNYPTAIWFGNGRLKDLPRACAEHGMRRPLLVTDEGLAGVRADAVIRSARERGVPLVGT